MNNEEYFDYLLDTFDREHKMIKIILIGKDDAIRLLVLDKNKWEENKGE